MATAKSPAKRNTKTRKKTGKPTAKASTKKAHARSPVKKAPAKLAKKQTANPHADLVDETVLTGTLDINGSDSRVNGTLLAMCGSASPMSDATAFLRGQGFNDGDPVTITGTPGTIGGTPVLCMTSAH
jgi:hypothetical protein